MIDMLAGCTRLFTDTFNAFIELAFFRLLIIFLMFQALVCLFKYAHNTVRKL